MRSWIVVALLSFPAAYRVNNAGSNGYRYGPLAETKDEALLEIVSTNVLGVMLCCREVGTLSRDLSAAEARPCLQAAPALDQPAHTSL